jgi:hypothetical protein
MTTGRRPTSLLPDCLGLWRIRSRRRRSGNITSRPSWPDAAGHLPLTRDGLERTDILAVLTEGQNRRLIELQVKTARGAVWNSISWPLGSKSQGPSLHEREYFVMVAVPHDVTQPPRNFILPRSHVAAAAWIEHRDVHRKRSVAQVVPK